MKMRNLFCLAVVMAVFLGSAWAQDIPLLIHYQGVLKNNNNVPVNGAFIMIFSIWSHPTQTNIAFRLWQEVQNSVPVDEGLFSVMLGSQTALPLTVFSSGTRYLEIMINTETLNPRQRILSAPFAYTAATATMAASVAGVSNIFPSVGNVGIGTLNPNPGFKLDVIGDVNLRNRLRIGGNTDGTAWTFGINGNIIHRGGGTSSALAMDISDRIGIGRTDPGAKLDINGSVRVGNGGTVITKILQGYIGTGAPNSVPSSGNITFPSAFSSTPKVFLQVEDLDGAGATSVRISAVSATGFSWQAWVGGTLTPADRISWLAIGN